MESSRFDSRPPRRERPGDFIHNIYKPQVRVPDPAKDFGMYARMDAACMGLHEYLDELRSNQGRVGYGSQNVMSDLSKECIEAALRGDEEEMAYTSRAMEQLIAGLGDSISKGELAERGNRFSKTVYQEHLEAKLFCQIWPVITGEKDSVPELTPWTNSKEDLQAYLYGFLDLVNELGKALTDEIDNSEPTTEKEFDLFKRYLAVADSITLRLSKERHIPGYIINNGYGHWSAFPTKLRSAYGTIAHIRREYNLARRIRRMIEDAFQKHIIQK